MKKEGNDKPIVIRGDRLREIRLIRGMTQKQVAKKAKLSLRQYGSLETEHPDCMFSTAIHLARVLGVSTDYLAGLSDDPEGRITEDDLPPGLRRLLEIYRGAKNGPDKLLEMLAAITSDESLRGVKKK